MSDVSNRVAQKLRNLAAVLRADADGVNYVNLRRAVLAEVDELEKRADSIEEQVKPVVEEPTEFGSIIWATNPDGEHKRWLQTGMDPFLGRPWISELDLEWRHFADLTEVKVLRCGLGDDSDPVAEWESDLFNAQHRREVAVSVLEAIDVDQYLIDAVRNTSPQTDDGVGAPPAATTADLALAAEAGEANATPAPSSPSVPLIRIHDLVRKLSSLKEIAVTAPEKRCYQRAAEEAASLLEAP